VDAWRAFEGQSAQQHMLGLHDDAHVSSDPSIYPLNQSPRPRAQDWSWYDTNAETSTPLSTGALNSPRREVLVLASAWTTCKAIISHLTECAMLELYRPHNWTMRHNVTVKILDPVILLVMLEKAGKPDFGLTCASPLLCVCCCARGWPSCWNEFVGK
jgi:hypothetical protein